MLGDKVGSTAIGPSGWALFPLLAGSGGLAMTAAIYAGGLLTGYAVGFAATYVFGLGPAVSGGLGVSTEADAEAGAEAGASASAASADGTVSGVCDASDSQENARGGNRTP